MITSMVAGRAESSGTTGPTGHGANTSTRTGGRGQGHAQGHGHGQGIAVETKVSNTMIEICHHIAVHFTEIMHLCNSRHKDF